MLSICCVPGAVLAHLSQRLIKATCSLRSGDGILGGLFHRATYSMEYLKKDQVEHIPSAIFHVTLNFQSLFSLDQNIIKGIKYGHTAL